MTDIRSLEMVEEEHRLDGLPGPLLDVDLAPDGGWVGLVGDEREQLLLIGGREFPTPARVGDPMVRAAGSEAALVVGEPSGKVGGANAWIIDRRGEVRAGLNAGIGIAEVLASEDRIVLTYFDEGVYSGTEPGQEGVAVFDTEGSFQFGYLTQFGRAAADVSDCYCASWAGGNRLAFFAYTDFCLVFLDLDGLTQEVQPAPDEVHGAEALTVAEGIVFFFAPYGRPHEILAWRPGGEKTRIVGRHTAPLRGLPGGRFIAHGEAGYTLVSFSPVDE